MLPLRAVGHLKDALIIVFMSFCRVYACIVHYGTEFSKDFFVAQPVRNMTFLRQNAMTFVSSIFAFFEDG